MWVNTERVMMLFHSWYQGRISSNTGSLYLKYHWLAVSLFPKMDQKVMVFCPQIAFWLWFLVMDTQGDKGCCQQLHSITNFWALITAHLPHPLPSYGHGLYSAVLTDDSFGWGAYLLLVILRGDMGWWFILCGSLGQGILRYLVKHFLREINIWIVKLSNS